MADAGSNLAQQSYSSAFAVDRLVMGRGAALQTLISLAERNSLALSLKKYALGRLRNHAFGEENQSSASEDPGTLRLSRSQLRLLRQEQLMLMSENERLVHELQEIRRSRATNTIRPTLPRIVPEFRESKLSKAIDQTLSGERDMRFNVSRVAVLSSLIHRLRLKVLGNVMRMLARQPVKPYAWNASKPAATGQPNIRQVTMACMIVETIVRYMVERMKRSALHSIMNARREGNTPSNYQRRPVDTSRLYVRGPHSSYQRQLPSVRRYMF